MQKHRILTFQKLKRNKKVKSSPTLILNGEELTFEGCVEGEILTAPEGDGGFGYDPVFRPQESDISFALMTADAKNAISHRGRATARLMEYLDNID